MGVGLGPFHRDQGGATPFAADAHALQKAHDGQDYRAPDADRGIARHKADGECRQAGQQQGRDQGHLAPDPVPIMPEQRGADRTRDKADGVDAEGLQGSDQRIGGRKKQFREDERGDLDVKQEIVSLDDRADGAGDDRAAQLPAVLGLGKRTGRDPGCCHRIPPRLARGFFARASRRQDIFFKSASLTAWEQRRKSPSAEMARRLDSPRRSVGVDSANREGWRAREEFEPLTPRSVVWCSIQLSYGRMRPSQSALAAPTTTPAATEKARRIAATRAATVVGGRGGARRRGRVRAQWPAAATRARSGVNHERRDICDQ